ncbi:hypothetical protein N7540_000178 [Penicillium herquei]|nr:hypothetical protein N7540_000178 [Penicillium herquei]
MSKEEWVEKQKKKKNNDKGGCGYCSLKGHKPETYWYLCLPLRKKGWMGLLERYWIYKPGVNSENYEPKSTAINESMDKMATMAVQDVDVDMDYIYIRYYNAVVIPADNPDFGQKDVQTNPTNNYMQKVYNRALIQEIDIPAMDSAHFGRKDVTMTHAKVKSLLLTGLMAVNAKNDNDPKEPYIDIPERLKNRQ